MLRTHQAVSAATLALVVAAATVALSASPPVASAQARSAVYESYDVHFEVRADGRVHVEENQRVVFRGGPFQTGYVELLVRGAEGIDVLGVAEPQRGVTYTQAEEEGREGTYRVERSGDAVTVRWWFPPTTDDERSFQVSYVLDGAVRFYDEGDQLWWKAIRPDRPQVAGGRVTVDVPEAAGGIQLASGYRMPGDTVLPMSIEGTRATLTLPSVPSGDEIEVRVQWPHGVVTGTPSAFQERFDESRADEQALMEGRTDPTRAILNIAAALISVIVGLGGLVGLYVMWYTRGRDVRVDLPATYLAEPPSDLSPGVVGVLIDEKGELRDVLATLVDLARRGELRMEERVDAGFLGLGSRTDFRFVHTPTGRALAAYEALLVDRVFDGRSERMLSSMRDEFYRYLPEVQDGLYEAAIDAGLFAESPEDTRRRYGCLAAVGFAAVGAAGLAAMIVSSFVPALLCVPASLAVVSVGALVVSRHMPRKTPAGAEAAARWRAFRRYLEDIDDVRDLEQAGEIFDRYLPYAIAFGLDNRWISAFAESDAPIPPWYVPWPHVGGPGRPWVDWGDGPRTLEGPGSPSGGGMPDLGRASQSLGGGLSSMSAGLASMLSSAAVVMTSQPNPTGGSSVHSGSFGGGGWSGGGFSGGGGGGGGGGGFG